MRPDRLTSLLLVAALASAAGAARAQTAAQMRAAAFRSSAAQATAATPVAFDLPVTRSGPERPVGIARTAIDHRFDRSDVDGSLGFLCGLQPKADTDGAAAAYGVDPQGRFLGVKLHLAFR